MHYYKDGKHKEISSHLVDGKMTEETIKELTIEKDILLSDIIDIIKEL